jgi:hypothetical protein
VVILENSGYNKRVEKNEEKKMNKSTLENKYNVQIVQRDKSLVRYGEKYMVIFSRYNYTDYDFKNLKEVELYLQGVSDEQKETTKEVDNAIEQELNLFFEEMSGYPQSSCGNEEDWIALCDEVYERIDDLIADDEPILVDGLLTKLIVICGETGYGYDRYLEKRLRTENEVEEEAMNILEKLNIAETYVIENKNVLVKVCEDSYVTNNGVHTLHYIELNNGMFQCDYYLGNIREKSITARLNTKNAIEL